MLNFMLDSANMVAPRVGAWIETNNSDYKSQIEASHPVWVRGLKHANESRSVERSGSRTPCGCVD